MICWVCGKRLVRAVTGEAVEGVEIDVDGNKVRAHAKCAKRTGNAVTARAATNEQGQTYVDDVERANASIGRFRLVHKRGVVTP